MSFIIGLVSQGGEAWYCAGDGRGYNASFYIRTLTASAPEVQK